MKICAISDLHGFLPEVPDCDVLVIGGDIVDASRESIEAQAEWLLDDFAAWLYSFVERKIVVIGIAGNHDFVFERIPALAHKLPWIYLCDSGIELGGVKFYGTPWQPWFGGWAFNAPEWQLDPNEDFLREKFGQIPRDVDVLITHGPPAGIRDRVGNSHVGSVALNRRIQEVMPKLVVTGHIHHMYGVEQVEDVMIASVSQISVKDGQYVPDETHVPMVFEI